KPYASARISAFAWRPLPSEEEARPIFFTDSATLPPEMPRGVDISQPWSDTAKETLQMGVIAHLPFAGMLIEAGAFSDRPYEKSRFADLMNGVAIEGWVRERTIIADAGG